MKYIQLLMLFLFATSVFAQNEAKIDADSLSVNKSLTTEAKPIFSNPSQMGIPSSLNMNRVYLNQLKTSSFQSPVVQFPTFNNKHFIPTNFTDNLHNQFYLNDKSWINTSKTSTNYIGLGGIYQIGTNYNYKIGDFGVITGGVYTAKFNIYNNFYNSVGVNGNFKLRINDRISMNLFGQYTPTAQTSIMQIMSPMYPQTNYGGSFEFKVTDKWGVITGAEREFDVFSRKWVTRPFFMPVFYGR